jgi:hypothetical protein
LKNFYRSPFSKWSPQYRKNSTLSDIITIWYVNCSMSWINSRHHNVPTYQIVMKSDNVDFLRYCGGHFENINQLKLFNVGIMMSRIDSRHWKISTGRHFQNGHHNTAKIQHCPISSQFDMWVDNDVLNTSLSTHKSNCDDIGQCWIFAILWWPFWKWRPVEIFQCRESIQDIMIYPHIKFWLSSQFDMWVDNDVPNWFPTLINFYWLPFSKWPPQCRKNSTLSDVIKIWCVGRSWCPELIPQIVMISDNVDFLRYCGGHFENSNQ